MDEHLQMAEGILMVKIVTATVEEEAVRALLIAHRHSELGVERSAEADALYVARSDKPDVSLWAAWDDLTDRVLGLGALRELSPGHGELKYIHVAEEARGNGVGSQLINHIIHSAIERGYAALSLETGSRDAFISARGMYRKHGFVDCGPFGSYFEDPRSVFMTLDLPPNA
jgi:putative acetyltransferase